mmetsp:Transcript_30778/g.57394  ORF Transcript_30778/g.57394 Transcript_30778/m.57394 type:complete len:305 (+) Transcript_30778:118-1032(+)|eukprot:CAMPEP_0114419326 /NCGR_PEP_ID=MMETSP0103-20121206/3964_1 /TAXON_ID=37642 ORGANISM="Paraphysomonas imperforata, Strain PA2" /NCGR_SAMPLE_ID=MMETSP0103 /ASSEMBLY_ACC=CAM_ASM_000201 /LENGTH=304 /DNA_ID=CAMNT_0001587731 /DNA_START=106 /DNA_END=1020 /DNA_ORIENTATION=+
MESDKDLVALDPEIISLGLSRDTAPKITLRITNISDSTIAFKVKTTQPTWYFVRPNQHVVEPKKTEEVTIVLIIEHCNRFLDMTDEERAESLEKHRFLVQSKTISDQLYNKILNLPPNGRADEFQKVWESSSKNDKKNQKLKVEFKLIDTPQEDSGGTTKPTPSIAENVEMVRNRISSMENSADHKHVHADVSGNPDAIISELQSLRKKYDAVVEYTVHLTAERDYHFSQLEEVRREYAREKSRHKSGGGDNGGDMKKRSAEKSPGGTNPGTTEVQQGFTLLTLIIVAVLSFLMARYTSGGNEL